MVGNRMWNPMFRPNWARARIRGSVMGQRFRRKACT